MTPSPPLSNIRRMDAELASLEQKLEQLISHCTAARTENQRLRERVASLENTNQELNAKLGQVGRRLEDLLARIPEA